MKTKVYDLIEEYHSEKTSSLNHSRLLHRICVTLEKFNHGYDVMPELQLELNGVKVKPDISVYPNLSIDWQNDVIYYDVPPITAIEILSPRQAVTDLTEKAYSVYLPSGVRSVWIVVPSMRIIQIITPDGATTITRGQFTDPATNISLTMEEIFK